MRRIRNKKGFVLIAVILFMLVTLAVSAGIYMNVFNFSNIQGIGEVNNLKGYYAAVGGLRYASLLLQNPSENLGLTTNGQTVTKSIRTNYSNVATDLGLVNPEDVTLTITMTGGLFKVDSAYSSPSGKGNITVHQDVGQQEYHAAYNGLETLQPGYTTNDFGITLYVRQGDYVEVTWRGSLYGNTYVQNYNSGPVATLVSPQLACNTSGVGVPATWKPFIVKSILYANGSGYLTCTQQFVRISNVVYDDYKVYLFHRGVTARIVSSAVRGT